MKTPMICLGALLACCFAVYGQQGTWEECGHGWTCAKMGTTTYAFEREPFDVAPQQWATYSQQVKKITVCDMGCVEIESPFGPREFEIVEHTHIGCADPRRALITTEDGVRHCYDLGRLENR